MALSLVQHASGAANADTVTITLAATGAGNALIVAASYNDNTDEALSSVTLGGSGSGFSSQYYRTGTSAGDINVWADFSIAGSQTSLVVTGQSGNTSLLSVDVYEVSGGLTALDKTAANEVDGSGTSWTSNATGATAVNAEFIVGIVSAYNNAGASFTLTGPGSPWTGESQLTPSASGGHFSQLSGYQISSTTGTFTYSGTASTTGSNLFYAAGTLTFEGPVSGGTGPKFYPLNKAVQARRQRWPQQGRIRSSPGGPPSTHVIRTSGGITFRPFGFQGYSLNSYGLLVTTQALVLLDAILLQQPAGSVSELALRLGTSPPTATTPMSELSGQQGYEQGGSLCAFNAASGGTAANSTALSWTNAASGPWDITGLELWDPDALGTDVGLRWMFADWSGAAISVAVGNAFVIPAGSLEISLQ